MKSKNEGSRNELSHLPTLLCGVFSVKVKGERSFTKLPGRPSSAFSPFPVPTDHVRFLRQAWDPCPAGTTEHRTWGHLSHLSFYKTLGLALQLFCRREATVWKISEEWALKWKLMLVFKESLLLLWTDIDLLDKVNFEQDPKPTHLVWFLHSTWPVDISLENLV